MKSWRPRSPGTRSPAGRGFTLLELLVACAVFMLLAALLLTLTTGSLRTWQQAEGRKDRQQTGRVALDMIRRDLEAAAFPIVNPGAHTLQFVLNDESRMGAQNLNPHAAFWQTANTSDSSFNSLDEVGYFVQWSGARSALCRYHVPAVNADSFFHQPDAWLTPQKIAAYAPGFSDTSKYEGLVVENIVGLWITLYNRDGTTTGLSPGYDSRATQARPAYAEVCIALLDSRAAQRLSSAGSVRNAYTDSIDDFTSRLPASLRREVYVFKMQVPLQAGAPLP